MPRELGGSVRPAARRVAEKQGTPRARRPVVAYGLVVVVAFLWLAAPAAAQSVDRDRPVELTADTLEYFARGELFVATGHVRLRNGDRSIEADWVGVARGSERGVASGNVVFRDGGDELRSSFLQFDIATLRGFIYDGELDTGSQGFLVEAEQMMRNDDDRYALGSGRFSTCRCPEGEARPWVIDTEDAEVEVGGYATAQNTTLEILGVPVLWLPWVIFPVKTERESGVLFPEFEIRGDSGFHFGLPLFWAARKNVGVIATPMYMTKRGFRPSVEVEYLVGRESKGEVFFAAGRDDKRADADNRDLPGDENNVTRWSLLAEHDQHLPGGVRAKADLHLISDNEVTEDWLETRRYRDDAVLESKLFVSGDVGRDGRLGWVGTSVFVNDLQALDSRDRDSIIHHIAPSLRAERLSGREPALAGLVTRLEVDYTHFYSDRLPQNKFGAAGDPIGDDLFLDIGVDARPDGEPGNIEPAGEGDGIFNEGEPLADRGHRFVLHPRVAYPMRWFDRLEVHPEVGYRQLLYSTRAQDSASAGHVTARVDLRTRLSRRFAKGRYQHIVEPLVGWNWVSRASSSGDPLFVPAAAQSQNRLRQLERDNVLLDPSDRVNERQTVTLGVSNRLYRSNRLAAELALSIDYHWVGDGTRFSVTREEENFSRVVLAGLTERFGWTSSDFHVSFDPDEAKVEEGLFSLSVTPRPWVTLRATYRYREAAEAEAFRFARQLGRFPWEEATDPLSQIEPGLTLLPLSNVRVRYKADYSFQFDKILRHTAAVELSSRCDCWAIGIDIKDRPGEGPEFLFRINPIGGFSGLRGRSSTSSSSLSGS